MYYSISYCLLNLKETLVIMIKKTHRYFILSPKLERKLGHYDKKTHMHERIMKVHVGKVVLTMLRMSIIVFVNVKSKQSSVLHYLVKKLE